MTDAQKEKVMQFRKKPVVIEAIQWDGSNTDDVLLFLGSSEKNWYASDGDVEWIVIETLEGRVRASIWDWIIKGIKGEFYPCKPDIFAETYEPASPVTEQGKAGEQYTQHSKECSYWEKNVCNCGVAEGTQQEPEELVIEIARELYDRFVMGGWEPQDAYPQIRAWLASRALPERKGWISVDEKLPERGCVVMLATNENQIEIGWLVQIARDEPDMFVIERTDPQDTPINFLLRDGQITHWMPLPEPPGGQREGR